MNVNTTKNNYSENDEEWIKLETFLSQTLTPVSPRQNFVSDLKNKLSEDKITYLEAIEKTKKYIFAIIVLVSSLILVSFWVQLIAMFSSYLKKKTHKSSKSS